MRRVGGAHAPFGRHEAPRLLDDRAAAGHSLQATAIAAGTTRTILVDRYVPDFARAAAAPAINLPIDDECRANPSPNLHVDEIGHTAPRPVAALAQRARVRVILYIHGNPQALPQDALDVDAVPSRHTRGRIRVLWSVESIGPGMPTPTPTTWLSCTLCSARKLINSSSRADRHTSGPRSVWKGPVRFATISAARSVRSNVK